jgi:hypothetical protein
MLGSFNTNRFPAWLKARAVGRSIPFSIVRDGFVAPGAYTVTVLAA